MRHFILAAALSALSVPAFADDAAVLLGVDRYEDLRRVSGVMISCARLTACAMRVMR